MGFGLGLGFGFGAATIRENAARDVLLPANRVGEVQRHYLAGHDAVEWVTYPELPDHPDHELAKQILPRGCGAVFSFGVRGGRAAGQKFIEKLELFSHLANIGDAKSLVIHPASTTHHRMDAAALEAAGISEGLIRLSVGIEEADDLIEDLGKALYAASKA